MQRVTAGFAWLLRRLMGLSGALALGAAVHVFVGMIEAPVLAWPFRPLMWLIGIPWGQSTATAALIATKTVLNEFVAYSNLAALPAGTFEPRSRLILAYALCGVANSGSLGIMIGGLGVMAPERIAEFCPARPAVCPRGHARHLHERRTGRRARLNRPKMRGGLRDALDRPPRALSGRPGRR